MTFNLHTCLLVQALLKECVKEHSVEVGPTTSYDAFFTALEPAADVVKTVHESNM